MPETISQCVSQRLLVEIRCRQCPHIATVDPRDLLKTFQHYRWRDSFEEVRQRHRCSQCQSKRLVVRGVRPPRVETTVEADRFVFAVGNRVQGPERPTWADAFEDAIDAGMGEYQQGRPFLTVPARIVNLRVD